MEESNNPPEFKLPTNLIVPEAPVVSQIPNAISVTSLEDLVKPAQSKTFKLPNSTVMVSSTPVSKDSLYDKAKQNPLQYELLPWEDEPTQVQVVHDIPTTDQTDSGSSLERIDPETGEIFNYTPPVSSSPKLPAESAPLFTLPTHMVGKLVKIPTPAQAAKAKLKKLRVSLEGVVNSVTDARHYRGSEAPNGHWDWPYGLMGAKEYTGFIYIIHDKNVNRLYLGKKSYRGRGKINKGQESNWRWYISSSEELANNVKAMQKEGFDYYCIEEYRAVGALSFAETWSLCTVEAPSNKDIWYNVLIQKVSWPVKEKITDRHKERLQEIVKKVIK